MLLISFHPFTGKFEVTRRLKHLPALEIDSFESLTFGATLGVAGHPIWAFLAFVGAGVSKAEKNTLSVMS